MILCEFIEVGVVKLNHKEVRQDMNGNWVGNNFSVAEAQAFNLFLNLVEISKGKLRIASFKI